MKKLIVGMMIFSTLPFVASAELVCPEGQVVKSVMTSAGSDAIPAVTHTEYRWRLTAFSSWSAWSVTNNAPHWVLSHNKQTRTVTDTPAVEAVPAVYEDQCVADEAYVPPAPTPAPKVTAPVSVAPQSSSVFRKLCNLKSAFGVGVCPVSDPSKGVIYQELYTKLIESLKAGLK